MIQSWLSRVPLVLLAAAIALSPSFSFGTVGGLQKIIEIRVEDILIIILAVIWLTAALVSGKARFEKPPLLLAITLWLGIGFFSLLLNWIFAHVSFIRGFFFFLKEIEFFIIYFYVFYHLKSVDAAKFLVKLWVVLGAANVVWVLYQLVTGNRHGEYGTAALSEWGVFPTGAFFLMIFTFLFNWWLYDVSRKRIHFLWKLCLLLVLIGCIIGIFGTLSKTNFLGAFFALFLSIFLFALKSKKIQTVLLSLGFSLVTAGIFLGLFYFFILGNLPSAERIVDILSPSGLFRSFESGRADAAIFPQLKEKKGFYIRSDVPVLQHFLLIPRE